MTRPTLSALALSALVTWSCGQGDNEGANDASTDMPRAGSGGGAGTGGKAGAGGTAAVGGAGATGGSSGGGGASGCLPLVLPASSFSFSGRGGFWGEGIYATVERSPIPTDLRGWTGLVIKIADQVQPGRHVFGSGDNADVSTCRVCPVLLQDVHGDNPTAAWFPRHGTLVLESADAATGQFVGRLEGLILAKTVQVGGLMYAGWEKDATCVAVGTVAFDTRVSAERDCLSASDCPNGRAQACDPQTRSCVPKPCSTPGARCAGDRVCVLQDPAYEMSACYTGCSPATAGACGADATCVPTDALRSAGVCKGMAANPPAAWASCSPTHVTTGCGSGHVCTAHAIFWHDDRCYPLCDFFAAAPGCPADSQCMLMAQDAEELATPWLCGRGDCYEGGICRRYDFDAWWISKAALGQPCEADRAGYQCDVAKGKVRNALCAGPDNRCRRLCRLAANDCAHGETCRPWILAEGERAERAVPGVGVCF